MGLRCVFHRGCAGSNDVRLLLFIQPWRYDATGGVNGGGYRTRRRVFVAGAVLNACIVALYIVTLTVGIPVFGREAGRVEPVSGLSLIVQIAELALILCLVRTVRRGDRFVGASQQDLQPDEVAVGKSPADGHLVLAADRVPRR